ncbi:hypothetical protein G4B88_026203 [Cannabis sativa]|uniref:2,4-dienoyl-CoA reductase [(3E)-enoyl-CoA-producing] n=1 Tax=Cannabis sativa TaxID=3483 RepID=A0A7J6E2S8_CANSA|nr:hypothetical protein G4B88_026815 [Cannabis sativa]KAF4352631.1 hypothetical protein G4B88_008800 [Cannabis sativa]KAF4362641.1 hypothetical protein G4B88_026203 [Cannabis sativa]
MESPFRADVVKDKVALITGGASGIGVEISTQFGKHGASIAIMGRRKHVIDSAISALRSLGISRGRYSKQEDAKRVLESTFEYFVMDIHSVGTFIMCHEALKYLKKGGLGRSQCGGGIIFNISAALHYTAAWFQIHVSAAKAALDAITRNLALEWGTDYDMKVNGIAPGPIADTPKMNELIPKQEMETKTSDYLPVTKFGETWDVAMAALYLVSDAANMVVDGGLWLSRPPHLPKEFVKQLSRAVEKKKSGAAAPLCPRSKI